MIVIGHSCPPRGCTSHVRAFPRTAETSGGLSHESCKLPATRSWQAGLLVSFLAGGTGVSWLHWRRLILLIRYLASSWRFGRWVTSPKVALRFWKVARHLTRLWTCWSEHFDSCSLIFSRSNSPAVSLVWKSSANILNRVPYSLGATGWYWSSWLYVAISLA